MSESISSNTTAGHACPSFMKAASNGVFQGDNPLDYALPLAIVQICLVLIVTRGLAFLLRPFRQPRVVAEIIGGVLLGPSALGRSKSYLNTIFPEKSLTVLDTLANIGLLFFLFLAGLELDMNSLRKTGKHALAIAVAGISLPFALGIGSSFVLRATIAQGVDAISFLVFMGVALSITAFPVLARILAELKLLTTDVGRMAMSAAAVNDVAAWILLALAIALSGDNLSPLVPFWVFLSGAVFVISASLTLRPIFKWMSKRCHEGEPVDETYICATLATVLASGLLTDSIGIHAMFGAFVLGILVPKEGPFAGALVEKVEDLVSGLFLPLYFVSSGLKTNVATIQGIQSWGLLALVIFTSCFGKIVGTVIVSLICKLPISEALALGFLMNTKGLVELIVLNIGKDRKVLNDQTFAIMVLMALFTTFMTTPIVLAVYKPAKRASKTAYKYRTIERENSNTQLRILTCFHSSRNIPSIINLLESSRGTDKLEGLCVYSLHLREFSERSSAILMVHKARKNGLPFWNKTSSEANHVIIAFEAFQQLSKVSVRPMTSISSLSTMHEDICSTAERKRAAIIVLPFHKHQRLDGSLETTRADFRLVNRRVLQYAPCSVGIFVDRGLGGNAHVSASNVAYWVVVPFFGGRDDREALAYGVRMAEHPGIRLTIIRFLVEPNVPNEIVKVKSESESSSKLIPDDNQFLSEITNERSEDSSMEYGERTISNSGEVIPVFRDYARCNLFLVGRSPSGEIPLALNHQRTDCPELGPVGNLLISPEFSTRASVLVVQQYHNEAPSKSFPEMEEALPSEDSDQLPG